ncbi:DUF3089 domain-containing protein [Hymenobacter sp. BT190]|uniref:DUF3089 domain-containing protein n=1 Tax=Hymenobacter sp. BT190 TaxID=2763505 RepID=UPI0016512A55|nr:DUF3089 domain-containing protein [Hymenobacter sp. BT190]MBC6696951.1 DUF3089 domain-containing protein [Hymenobacter sp. BT190]
MFYRRFSFLCDWLPRLSVWLLPLLLVSCIGIIRPRREFTTAQEPPVPDYTLPANWAALPTTRDSADAVPLNTNLRDQQATASADVFFVHLTTLILSKSWNADPANTSLNEFTDKLSIMRQASVFNAAGRIYAPHYRQATLYAFFDSTANGSRALELAYQDVKASFRYYLTHYNQGRPIILAGHSQGAYHARRLLQEFFDEDPKLRRQLVAAYLIGFEVRPERYKVLQPCQDSLQTSCYMSWNTAEWGYDYPPYHGAVVTNPLTWKTDTVTGPAVLNRGSVPSSFNRLDTTLTAAKIHNGVLWVHPPKASGYPRFLLPGRPELRHSFHLADYGLFYLNVRRNAVARVQAFNNQSPRP